MAGRAWQELVDGASGGNTRALARLITRVVRARFADGCLDEAVKRVRSGDSDPYSAAEAIVAALELGE
jgi:hypothetical protein